MGKLSEVVTVNNVPIRVDSWGGFLPCDVKKNPASKPEELILVIPGNPGVIEFYEEFSDLLYQKTKKPVWILSHGGHNKGIELPEWNENKGLFNLCGQIDQKKMFFETYLKNTKIICIGHSIGCKMLLELLKIDDIYVNIKKCYFLFPTIERMAETPNGQMFIFIYQYFLWLILIGCFIFINLPEIFKVNLVKGFLWVFQIPFSNLKAILELIDPHVVSRSLFLADDEMKNVRELEKDKIEKFSGKLKLYYGSSDGWAPARFYYDLKKENENLDVEICSRGIEHAFVLKHSSPMAQLVSEWIMDK